MARTLQADNAFSTAIQETGYTNSCQMQVLQAGQHKLIYLELEPEMVSSIAKQAGFDTKAKDRRARHHAGPHGGRPAVAAAAVRCGRSGQPGMVFALPVLHGWPHRGGDANAHHPGEQARPRRQARSAIPCASISPRNCRPASGCRASSRSPSRCLYALLFNFLNALMKTGVAVCGGDAVQALAGRTESIGPRN